MRTDYAGKTVTIRDGFVDPFNGEITAGTPYEVEGYWDELTGNPWPRSAGTGNYAALNYAQRLLLSNVPVDNDVLYGKIGAFGFLVHVSEVE